MSERTPDTPSDAGSESGSGPTKVRRPTALTTATKRAGRKASAPVPESGASNGARTRAKRAKTAPTDAPSTTTRKRPTRGRASGGPVAVMDPPPATEPAVANAPVELARTSLPAATVSALDVRQGAVGRDDAEDVAVSQGAIGFARGERVSVEMGAIGAGFGGEVRVTQGVAGTVIAREVVLEQTLTRSVIARDVVVRRPSAVLFLLAQRVEGDVRALVDWRGALAFGAVVGLLVGLLRRRG